MSFDVNLNSSAQSVVSNSFLRFSILFSTIAVSLVYTSNPNAPLIYAFLILSSFSFCLITFFRFP